MQPDSVTEKEKQHYVPKFLLRYFSFRENQKEIGVLNTSTNFVRPNCPLKGQAYKPFFYGKDGVIEDFIGNNYEGPASQIIREIINSSSLPSPGSRDYILLLEFIILSLQRTPKLEKLGKESSKWLRDLYEEAWTEYSQEKPPLPDEELDMVLENLSQIELGAFKISDLEVKLLINETRTPFIITDNPVIKYNQYLEEKGSRRGSVGLGNMGIQIFICITPNHCIMLYDSWAYKVGSASKNWLRLLSERDVYQINILSFLNCDQMVFFNHGLSVDRIRSLFEDSKKYEKAGTVRRYSLPASRVRAIGVAPTEEGTYHLAVHCGAMIRLRLSFLTLTKEAKRYQLNTGLVHMRESYWRNKHIEEKYFPNE